MAKKGQAQLQIEVTNDEEWEKLLQKEGLIVVDIYSDWCGPCNAMLNNLKKLKLELGGDYLHIAQAKSDGITDLLRFRSKSEPTWMLVSAKQMIKLIFGADSPRLIQEITEELEREAQIREGTRERVGRPITDLSPEEEEVYLAKKAIEDEANRIQEQKAAQALHDRRMAVAQVVLETVPKNGLIIVFPQARDMVRPALSDFWEPAGLAVQVTERPIFTEAMLEEMLYFTDFRFNEYDVAELLSSSTVVFLVKPTDSDFDGSIDDLVKHFVYGEMMEPPGSPDSPCELLKGHVVIARPNKSADELHSSLSIIDSKSKTHTSAKDIRSKLHIQSSVILHSKETLDTTLQSLHDINQESYEITGIWAPSNNLVRATAIKLLFPRIYEPVAIPEPIPTPPHIAIAFDAIKRREVFDLVGVYENDVMNYGFFTSDNSDDTKLIAKTMQAYERSKDRSPNTRMVIQLSRKVSDPICAFSQFNPTYISHNTAIGEDDCKKFFPEGYNEGVEEEVVAAPEHKKKKSKKGKKGKAPSEADITHEVGDGEHVEEEPAEEEHAEDEQVEGEHEEEEEEDEEAEEENAQEQVEQVEQLEQTEQVEQTEQGAEQVQHTEQAVEQVEPAQQPETAQQPEPVQQAEEVTEQPQVAEEEDKATSPMPE